MVKYHTVWQHPLQLGACLAAREPEPMSCFDKVEIPYGAYWSTPFAKWQGALQHLHSLRLAAHVAKLELDRRGVAPEAFDFSVLGTTVAQHQSFFGAAWPCHDIGLRHVTGPALSQVCATGPRVLLTAAAEIQLGMAKTALALGADRLSNGPHIYYPAPSGPGGTGASEEQTVFSFAHDPVGGHAMLQTAENVARKHGIRLQDQHEVVLRRYEQYQSALVGPNSFQSRYMTLPLAIPKANFKGTAGELAADEGIAGTTAEKLASLRPVMPDGTVTYAAQTHPADGNCGMILTTAQSAAELSRDPGIRIRLLSFGQARVELAYMPEAPVPATQRALDNAGLSMRQVKAVKSHNPFAVNDIVFARATGFELNRMNNYGCSLIWGHPHAATGMRAIIELIEELVISGGGIGLFQGCAAGDSAMAALIEVSDR
jgi:acetyl-CoA acetyltransferase family protein